MSKTHHSTLWICFVSELNILRIYVLLMSQKCHGGIQQMLQYNIFIFI